VRGVVPHDQPELPVGGALDEEAVQRGRQLGAVDVGHVGAQDQRGLVAPRPGLQVPGLPDGLADQLRDLSDDAATLPLPVPAELVSTSTADVGGAGATVLSSRDGLVAAVVWVEDGVMTGVAGSLSADELLSVARGLR